MNGTEDTKTTRQHLLDNILWIVRELEQGSEEPDEECFNCGSKNEEMCNDIEMSGCGDYDPSPTEYHNPKRVLDFEFISGGRGDFRGVEVLATYGGPTITICTKTDTVTGSWGGEESISRRYADNFGLHERYERLFHRILILRIHSNL